MISAKQIKAARLFLDWEQRDLAQHSGLSIPTIQRMEKLGVERSSAANAQKVQQALETGGVEFIPAMVAGLGYGCGRRERDERSLGILVVHALWRIRRAREPTCLVMPRFLLDCYDE